MKRPVPVIPSFANRANSARLSRIQIMGRRLCVLAVRDHEDQGMMQNIRIAPMGGYLEGKPTPTEPARKHGH